MDKPKIGEIWVYNHDGFNCGFYFIAGCSKKFVVLQNILSGRIYKDYELSTFFQAKKKNLWKKAIEVVNEETKVQAG